MNEIAIRNVDDIVQLAKIMGGSALLPDALRGKPQDVFVTVLYGHELGFSPMASVQGIYVVKGKPFLAGQTWIALARRAGHRLSVNEHTAETCTVTIVRGDTGESHTETYSVEEARTAKLLANDNWVKNPKRMLLARAVVNACRFACPEIALGVMAEGEDITDAEPDVIVPDVPAEDVQDAEVVTDPVAAAAAVQDIEAEFAEPTEPLFAATS